MSYRPKIAIIIPTILRDDLLMETINSILDIWDDNWKVYIIDQNRPEDDTTEKTFFYQTAASQFHDPLEQRVEVIRMPFDSGIAISRNVGVQYAKAANIPYCMISADSIKFNESLRLLTKQLDIFEGREIDLLGFNLKNRKIGWEGWLKLVENSHFEISFIDKTENRFVYPCSIVRNFFVASTESLYNSQWDENLKACEHEDFFYTYGQNGYKCGWIKEIYGDYIGKKEVGNYMNVRTKNFQKGRSYLLAKHHLKRWVEYVNLDRAKDNG